VDNASDQEKLEARKVPENAAESYTPGARFVGQTRWTQDSPTEKQNSAHLI